MSFIQQRKGPCVSLEDPFQVLFCYYGQYLGTMLLIIIITLFHVEALCFSFRLAGLKAIN